MQHVVIVQRRLTHYRVPLLEALRVSLLDHGIRLNVVHGQSAAEEALKSDAGTLGWAHIVNNTYLNVGPTRLCWQHHHGLLGDADLIVLTQESSLLSNYPVLLGGHKRGARVAFWGHGANLQSTARDGWREIFKRWTSRRVDWWFAYTSLSVNLVTQSGFPIDRITNVENAIDTTEVRDDILALSPHKLQELRRAYGVEGSRVALFLGSLYPEKRLDFLIRVGESMHEVHPDFRLIIVGDGPSRDYVRNVCERQSWCIWLGARKDKEKAELLAIADVLLNPGAVGLTLLDSFAAGVPLVTTRDALHGPEIAYLEHGRNGVLTDGTLHDYITATRRVLTDSEYRATLIDGCRVSGARYTIDNMARNFKSGILEVLSR